MAVAVWINYNLVTEGIRFGGGAGLTVTRSMDGRSTARLTCDSMLLPPRRADVLIYDIDGVTPLFRGVILNRTHRGISPQHPKTQTDLECGDGLTFFDWIVVDRIGYPTQNSALKTVLQDLVNFVLGYGVTLHPDQEHGPTLAPFEVRSVRGSDVLRELGDKTGWVATMDPQFRLRMRAPGSTAAPVALTPTGRHWRELTWRDGDRLSANEVVLYCGPDAGDYIENFTITANGTDTSWKFQAPNGFAPYTPEGGGSTLLENGVVRHTHVGMEEYTWNFETATLGVGTAGIPPAGTVLWFQRLITYPFRIVKTTGATPKIQAQRRAPDVVTIPAGEQLAEGLLAQLNQSPRELQFTSLDAGWEPGQQVTVALPAERGFNGVALITEVETRFLTQTIREFAIAATESPLYQGNYLSAWRELLQLGGMSAITSGEGAIVAAPSPTFFLTSPAYLGGSRVGAIAVTPPEWTPALNAVWYYALSNLTARLHCVLFARHAGVGVTARLLNLTTGAVVCQTSKVTAQLPHAVSAIGEITQANYYELQLLPDTPNEGVYGLGWLERP